MRWVCSYNGCRPQMITCFWYNQVPLVYLNYFYLGGISNSLRGNDRLNYHTSRRERSIKVLIVNVRDYLKITFSADDILFCISKISNDLFQCSHRRIVQYKTAYYSFYLPVSNFLCYRSYFPRFAIHFPMNQAIFSVIIDHLSQLLAYILVIRFIGI